MSKKQKIVFISAVVVALLLLAAAVVAVRLYYVARINPRAAFASGVDTEQDQQSPAPAPTNDLGVVVTDWDGNEATPSPTPDPLKSNFDKEKINVLLLGWDESPERNDEDSALYRDEKNNFRSDVMMLLVIDLNNQKADMVSIPRDSYADIYQTEGKWKINAAFAKGGSAQGNGFDYTMKTVSMLMGDVTVDYYVGVDMQGIKALVDAIGGIDYDVDVEIKLNDRVLSTGQQHLDGQQVLDYCRARKGIGTDLNRIDRQQRILFSTFEQIQSNGKLQQLPDIYLALKDMVHTNLNMDQISALVGFSAGLNLSQDIQRHTLEGEYMDAYGVHFYVLNQNKKGQLIQQLYGFEPEFDQEHDVSYVRSRNAPRRRLSVQEAQTPAEAEASLPQETDALTTLSPTPTATATPTPKPTATPRPEEPEPMEDDGIPIEDDEDDSPEEPEEEPLDDGLESVPERGAPQRRSQSQAPSTPEPTPVPTPVPTPAPTPQPTAPPPVNTGSAIMIF